MKPLIFLFATSCIVVLPYGVEESNAMPPNATDTNVRELLNGREFKEERQQLIDMAERACPAFDFVFSDPKANSHEIARVFGVLAQVRVDRRQFLDHAIVGLAHSDASVRWAAVRLLEDIGSSDEASPVVALLSDGEKVADKVIAYAAAKTLSVIGGRREVTAMDAWLLGSAHRDDQHLRAHVKKCREELDKRLKAAAKAKAKR